jgi:uncharacterized protein (TIGR02118 family)
MRAVSASYFVRYEGQAKNPEAFLAHYRDHHVPLLARFPGIRRIVLHTPTAWEDPYPIQPDRFSLLVQMVFDSLEDLETAVRSEARAAARADFEKLPPFHGAVYHQAAISEEVFAK